MDGAGPYPTMKDSGVEWLGDVPAHWGCRRLKTLCAMQSGEAITAESIEATGEYSVYGGNGIRGFSSQYTHDGVYALIGRQGALCGNVHLARGRFWASEHAVVTNLHGGHAPEWFVSILQAMNLNQYSIAAAQPGLSVDRLLNLWAPVPPQCEQRTIARFLNHAMNRIDRYIRAKEKLIALLEEQKRATIIEVVTGQIDVRSGRPYSAYKQSVVDGLSPAPKHWQRWRLKWLLRSVDRRSGTGSETLLSLRRDHGVVVYADHFARPPQGATLVGFKHLRPGQLVVNRLQANNGLVFHSALDGLVSPDYSVFEAARPLEMQYLSDLLRLREYRAHFRREAKGLGTGTAGFLRLYDDAFLRTLVHLPPVEEQRLIVDWLEGTVQKIDQASGKVRRERDLMKEFERLLVADVVTGKLDVRQATVDLDEQSVTCGVGVGRASADSNSSVPQGVATLEQTS